MTWVRSEYAPELAVVSAWLSALLPWYVAYVPSIENIGRAFVMRFLIVQIRYFLDFSAGESVDTHPVTLPLDAKALQQGSIEIAYDVWIAGGSVIAFTALLGLIMYIDFEGVQRVLPVDAVRVVGGLLTLGGGLLLVSSALFWYYSQWGEYPLPIGSLIALALGIGLLTVERVEVDEESADGSDDGEANAGGDASTDPNSDEGVEGN